MACPWIKGKEGAYRCVQTDRKRCLKSWKKTQFRLTPRCFTLNGVEHSIGIVYEGIIMGVDND